MVKIHPLQLLVSAILGIAWLVLNKWYRNFREFGEGMEGINFFRKHSTGMNLPFEYQVFHTNGKCSKVSCQWKQCDGKARSETRKISVRGEEWYYHVFFKIRSFSHFYWTFAKSFVSHFRFWQKAAAQRARAHCCRGKLLRKILSSTCGLIYIFSYSIIL